MSIFNLHMEVSFVSMCVKKAVLSPVCILVPCTLYFVNQLAECAQDCFYILCYVSLMPCFLFFARFSPLHPSPRDQTHDLVLAKFHTFYHRLKNRILMSLTFILYTIAFGLLVPYKF